MVMTSKRQEWILQLIKGPDIIPVGNQPGLYSSNNTIQITADETLIVVKPSDTFDLSHPEVLIVRVADAEHSIRWERISNLDFDEPPAAPAVERPRPAAYRLLHFPLGKKVV